MGWSVSFDSRWNRDIGYGVPATCDRPACETAIDRGLGYVCGSYPYGGEYGCGLYFCGEHLCYRQPKGADRSVQLCPRCLAYRPPYKHPSPDTAEWLNWKLTDESWAQWREENPAEMEHIREQLRSAGEPGHRQDNSDQDAANQTMQHDENPT